MTDRQMTTMTLTAERTYLAVPVYLYDESMDRTERVRFDHLRLFYVKDASGKIIFRFVTSWKEDMTKDPDYVSCLNIGAWRGQRLTIETEQPKAFLDHIAQTDHQVYSYATLKGEEDTGAEDPARPQLHYTAPVGWINDPNGLVYQNGVWHLFYQHNPMNVEWANMSWGHAVSDDLLHFHYVDDIMFPDDNGAMFSGCGLVNERGCFGLPKDALLFFYTASQDPTRLVPGVVNTQRLAFSTDNGKTIQKFEGWHLSNLGGDNRDPKIFWHEETKSYVMVLFLQGKSFAILRSADLEEWEITQKMDYDPMWECPDLVRLRADDGIEKWAFLSADGYYYLGNFDGYVFTPETGLLHLFEGEEKLPYAGQTYSNTDERVIQIAWLRIPNRGTNYTGALSLPRELFLGRDEKGYYIRQRFAAEALPYEEELPDGSVRIRDSYIQETISPEGRYCTVRLI